MVDATVGTPQPPLTRLLVDALAPLRFSDLPAEAITVAKQCLLDWLGVTLAGSREPLARMLRAEVLEDGGRPQSTLVGDGERVTAAQAALVNGAASHALDYDDVQTMMSGHPTVPVAPAAIALAETLDSSGADLLIAFVAGVEAECRIGALVMPSHYSIGWHATGTLGTFGAVAACAHLLRLTAAQWEMALGIAGTQAAGLKASFGTMCKPLHAGKAAANGLLAAKLASRGFSANPEVLETAQGFTATQTTSPHPDRLLDGLGESFAVRDVLFKYHAACFGTHATIEAILRLREQHGFTADQVRSVELRVPPGHLAMCNIADPQTPLEGKFSLRFTAALALAGAGTDEATFTEERMRDPQLDALHRLVTVVPNPEMSGIGGSETWVTLDDGSEVRLLVDMNVPDRDLDRQQARLEAKFASLATPLLGPAQTQRVIAQVRALEHLPSVRGLMQLVAAGNPVGVA